MSERNSITPDAVRAVAYYRVGTSKQENNLSAQREAVHAYAARHGYQIVAEHQDAQERTAKEGQTWTR
jgi:DNA invertase Pin-like site-specific DNA recombinase